MDKIINVPFGYLLDWLYQFTTNYGVALILFAVIVQLVLLPITAKSKRSMMKMSRISPRLQEIKEKYANDQQKQTEAIQKLYKDENVSMTGGCLWSFVPLLILIPLYAVIREPIPICSTKLRKTQERSWRWSRRACLICLQARIPSTAS